MDEQPEPMQHEAIRFLLDLLEEITVQAKAQGFALRILGSGRDLKGLIDTFEQQVAPQVAPIFARLRETMLSTGEQGLSPDWEDKVRKLIDSAQDSDAPE